MIYNEFGYKKAADCYANNFKRKIYIPRWDYLQEYLFLLRKVEKYNNNAGVKKIKLIWYKYRLKQISVKLGISIEPGCFGGG